MCLECFEFFLRIECMPFNYADDNTVGCIGDTMNDEKNNLKVYPVLCSIGSM